MKRCVLLLIAVLSVVLNSTAFAQSAQWQPFDRLGEGDRAMAEGTLADTFGANPGQWPDWIDPRAALIPTFDGEILAVRRPVHAPCGQFYFSFFSPVSNDRTRQKLGDDFCGGSLTVIPNGQRVWPDLLLGEGRQWAPETGDWRPQDQRIRWTGSNWVLIVVH